MKKLIISLVIIVCYLLPITVKGDTNNLDFDKKGEISFIINTPDTKKPISNLKVKVYYIGTMDKKDNNIGYTITKAFENSGVYINDDDILAMTKAFTSYAINEKIPADIIVTNEIGIARLEGCELGLYLIVPDKMIKGSIYCDIDPMIISVPYTSEDGSAWIYNVEAIPKIEIKKEEPKKPTDPPGDNPKLPQTGILQWPVPVLTLTGVLLFCLGWINVFLKKNHEKQ